LQLRLKRRCENPATNLAADDRELFDVVHIEIGECFRDAIAQSVVLQEIPVRLRGRGESAGNTHAHFRKMTDHLAER
jgi:hypothetical protein